MADSQIRDPIDDSRQRQARDLLPPVQPPAAGFLVQLFVTPMLIVGLVVGAWLLVTWLARPQQDPRKLVEEIGKLNHRSWQQALALANQLQDPEARDLRANAEVARELGEQLRRQLRNKRPGDDTTRLLVYLCRAAGEFETDAAMPALLDAASATHVSQRVRRAAMQSLGMLSRRRAAASEPDPDVVDILVAASGEADKTNTVRMADLRLSNEELEAEARRVRSTAAYALGLVGGKVALQRLIELLQDSDPDVRCNAATALARLGHEASIPGLLAMLQGIPVVLEASGTDADVVQRQWKEDLLVSTALRAVATLLPKLSPGAVPQIEAAVAKIVEDEGQSPEIRQEARDVQQLVSRM